LGLMPATEPDAAPAAGDLLLRDGLVRGRYRDRKRWPGTGARVRAPSPCRYQVAMTVHFEWGPPRLASSLGVTWDEEGREAG
jgi:hypothetical protein